MECVKESRICKPAKKSPAEMKERSATINKADNFTEDFEINYPTIPEEIPTFNNSQCSSELIMSSEIIEQDIPELNEEISLRNSLEDPLNKNSSGLPTSEIVASQKIPKDPAMALGQESATLDSMTVKNSQEPIASEVTFKMLRKELELKKVQLKKEQLEMERQLAEKDFKVRTELLEAEIELEITKMANLEESISSSANIYGVQNQKMDATDKIDSRMPSPSSPPLPLSAQDNQVISSGLDFRLDRMPVPASTAPLGLQQLINLDCVTVRKLRSQNLEETYEVVIPREGLVVFRANVAVGFIGDRRVLRVDFIDNEVKEMATFRAGPDASMDLYICGHLAAKVNKVPTYFKPMLMVHDQFAKPVLKVKGPSRDDYRHTFHVQTLNKRNIGSLDKRPAHASPHYDAPHAVIRFPADLDARFKVALVAANFLIVDTETYQRRLQAPHYHQHQQHEFQHTSYPTSPYF